QTFTCTGTGGNTDGTTITTGETLKYQTWRGINSNFDPTCTNPVIDCGVIVADYWDAIQPAGAQPPIAPPGGVVTWVDSAANTSRSHFPPASCKNYFYRVRVADRCARQAN